MRAHGNASSKGRWRRIAGIALRSLSPVGPFPTPLARTSPLLMRAMRLAYAAGDRAITNAAEAERLRLREGVR